MRGAGRVTRAATAAISTVATADTMTAIMVADIMAATQATADIMAATAATIDQDERGR